MKLATTRCECVTGLVALSAGTLNSGALLPLRASPQDAWIDFKKPLEQYFETCTAQKMGITWKHDNALSTPCYLPEWPATIGHTYRFEHVRAGNYYYLAPGGKLL